MAERHLRWSKDGTCARIFTVVRRDLVGHRGEDLMAMLSVDSTIVRAHQHAAGARAGVLTGG